LDGAVHSASLFRWQQSGLSLWYWYILDVAVDAASIWEWQQQQFAYDNSQHFVREIQRLDPNGDVTIWIQALNNSAFSINVEYFNVWVNRIQRLRKGFNVWRMRARRTDNGAGRQV